MFNAQVLTESRESRAQRLTRDVFLVLGASALIAIAAQIRIPLPFSPVPFTMQTFAVLFLAAMLGGKKGALAVVAYLAEGALGLPVFSGGNAGLLYMTGATGGYLVGFVIAAYATGRLMEKKQSSGRTTCSRALFALILGHATIHAFGVAWLGSLVGFNAALAMGFYPFLIGDIIKGSLSFFGTRVIKPFSRP